MRTKIIHTTRETNKNTVNALTTANVSWRLLRVTWEKTAKNVRVSVCVCVCVGGAILKIELITIVLKLLLAK